MRRARVTIRRLMLLVALAALVAAVAGERGRYNRVAAASEAEIRRVVRKHTLCQRGRFLRLVEDVGAGREVVTGPSGDVADLIFGADDRAVIASARVSAHSRRAILRSDAVVAALGLVPFGLVAFGRCRRERGGAHL